MEKSYVKYMDFDYLTNIGFSKNQIDMVNKLTDKAINQRLYSNTKIPYHNIKHIERVIMYSIWILNEKEKKGELLENRDVLLLAALYHDCGRNSVFNKMHGIIGAKIARDKLRNTMNYKIINSICLLIETHAVSSDRVNFNNYNYTLKEKKNIQTLSDILKDADALDRNRIKLFPFLKCNVNKLRTLEAKDIYNNSDLFYFKYKDAVKKSKKLNEWLIMVFYS